MKILIITLCCFFVAFQTIAQTQSNHDTIFWSPCYKLKYEDFKGKPDTTKIDLANSRIGINYIYHVVNGKLQFKVTCYFLKSISWSKYNMPALMIHEQAHFDIAKLFTLKLEKRLSQCKLTPSIDNDVKAIYNTIVAERLVMDNLYDKTEKENPTNAISQNKFERDIRKQLPICKKKG